MQFKEWGEDCFVQHLAKHFKVKKPLIGIGDDCAVIPGQKGKSWVVTTDALVEGVHFLKEEIPPEDLGYKTVAVNVSDIAAMGGEPKYAFFAAAFPKDLEDSWVKKFMHGLREACQKWRVLLLGGDTVGSKRDVFLNLALMGEANSTHIKYRHQAKHGDIICTTGFLGDSGGGLKVLLEKRSKGRDSLLKAHFRPEPCPATGIWLASQEGVHAMMDVSDGLDCDLRRILASSKKGAEIETSKLPISPSLWAASSRYHWDPLELALTGGEDYCLLLTVDSNAFQKIQRGFKKKFGTPLFEIGSITGSRLEYLNEGQRISLHYKNFDHFK
jgi:thiamine-monophosphate kinase